jgi:hypothetical protein
VGKIKRKVPIEKKITTVTWLFLIRSTRFRYVVKKKLWSPLGEPPGTWVSKIKGGTKIGLRRVWDQLTCQFNPKTSLMRHTKVGVLPLRLILSVTISINMLESLFTWR